MVRNPLSEATTPAFQDVLDALDDPTCRRILQHLEEPRSADELVEETDIPRSTVYRKLDLLRDAGLVSEFTEIRRDGGHTSRYECSFGAVRISMDDDDREFHASIKRQEENPDEKLEDLWSEVRKST